MKKFLPAIALLVCMTVLFYSCAVNKLANAQRKIDTQNSKESQTGCFVRMNDGTLKNYTSLKLVTGIFQSPHLLADGQYSFYPRQILAYQNADHYAVSQKAFSDAGITRAAVETLPGFAIRIAKGNVNIYCKKYFNGSRAVDEFFVQKGNDDKILAYSAGNMHLITETMPEVQRLFKGFVYIGETHTSPQAGETESRSYSANKK